MSSFCEMPIVIDKDMPVGCMVVVSGDGKQIIPIINLDIEVCGNLPKEPPKIEYGKRTITGTMTTKFESEELYARFVSGMSTMGRHAMNAIINLGDQVVRNGALNRSGRKQWRKDRKRLVTAMRREDARAMRLSFGLKAF